METLANLAPTVVDVLSVLTVLAQIFIVLLIAAPYIGLKTFRSKILRHSNCWMLLFALTATLGSLYFSDIAGWTPCKLCWYQRIFMYPQVILLGLALYKKDRSLLGAILAFSIIGAVIAIFHYSEQVNLVLNPVDVTEPCDASGVSCARTPFFHFGYITIPMMALTVFLANGVIAFLALTKKR